MKSNLLTSLTYQFFGIVLVLCLNADIFAQTSINGVSEFTGSLFSTSDNKSSSISSIEKAKFLEDATRIVLRNQQDDNTLAHLPIQVDQAAVEQTYAVLTAIYQSDAKNTASLSTFQIHTTPTITVDGFLVLVDIETQNGRQLSKGLVKDTDPILQKMIKENNLSIVPQRTWDEQHHLVYIKAETPINIKAIAIPFSTLDGIALSELQKPTKDGGDIQIKIQEDGWNVKYFYKFQDCDHECKKMHVWEYHVDQLFNVQFIKSYGDQIPSNT